VAKSQGYFRVGDYDKALESAKQAYLLNPKPELLVGIGQCYQKLGDRVHAVESYRRFLSQVPDAPIRADLEKRITELEAALEKEKSEGVLEISSNHDPAKVSLDGREQGTTPVRLERLEPGVH
jgi:tetratricopeptide (TPR) repeat protein